MAFTAEALEPGDWQDEAELAAVVPFAPVQAASRAWVLAPSSEEVAELRKQIDVKVTAAKMLNERVRKLTAEGVTKDKRIAALEAQLAAIHEDVSHRENENHSLRTSLDLSVVEGARLSGRLWDTGVEADALRARLETLKATLIASEGERDRLTAAKRDAIELHRIELDALTNQLQAMTAQTATAESRLVDLRRSLAARTDDSREASRKAEDAARERDVAVAELAELRDRLRAKDRVTQDLEQSRAQLMDQAGNLLEAFEARAAALAEAEAKAQSLSRQVKEAEVKSVLAQNQIASLTAKLERGEAAFAEAADAVRSLVKRATDAEANAREAQSETERLTARMRSHEAALAEASELGAIARRTGCVSRGRSARRRGRNEILDRKDRAPARRARRGRSLDQAAQRARHRGRSEGGRGRGESRCRREQRRGPGAGIAAGAGASRHRRGRFRQGGDRSGPAAASDRHAFDAQPRTGNGGGRAACARSHRACRCASRG